MADVHAALTADLMAKSHAELRRLLAAAEIDKTHGRTKARAAQALITKLQTVPSDIFQSTIAATASGSATASATAGETASGPAIDRALEALNRDNVSDTARQIIKEAFLSVKADLEDLHARNLTSTRFPGQKCKSSLHSPLLSPPPAICSSLAYPMSITVYFTVWRSEGHHKALTNDSSAVLLPR